MHATRTAEVEAAYLMPHLSEGQRLLDVGCGPGTMTVGFAKHVGATGHVTAIDTVDAVLDQAQEALANAQNATVEKASVYELPYVRESPPVSACPTAATALRGLAHFPSMNDVARVLRLTAALTSYTPIRCYSM